MNFNSPLLLKSYYTSAAMLTFLRPMSSALCSLLHWGLWPVVISLASLVWASQGTFAMLLICKDTFSLLKSFSKAHSFIGRQFFLFVNTQFYSLWMAKHPVENWFHSLPFELCFVFFHPAPFKISLSLMSVVPCTVYRYELLFSCRSNLLYL